MIDSWYANRGSPMYSIEVRVGQSCAIDLSVVYRLSRMREYGWIDHSWKCVRSLWDRDIVRTISNDVTNRISISINGHLLVSRQTWPNSSKAALQLDMGTFVNLSPSRAMHHWHVLQFSHAKMTSMNHTVPLYCEVHRITSLTCLSTGCEHNVK